MDAFKKPGGEKGSNGPQISLQKWPCEEPGGVLPGQPLCREPHTELCPQNHPSAAQPTGHAHCHCYLLLPKRLHKASGHEAPRPRRVERGHNPTLQLQGRLTRQAAGTFNHSGESWSVARTNTLQVKNHPNSRKDFKGIPRWQRGRPDDSCQANKTPVTLTRAATSP